MCDDYRGSNNSWCMAFRFSNCTEQRSHRKVFVVGIYSRTVYNCIHSHVKETMKPISEDKQDGFKLKYQIAHADGTSCDPNATYFILRLDFHEGCDTKHVAACRKAALTYATEITDHLPKLSADLKAMLT